MENDPNPPPPRTHFSQGIPPSPTDEEINLFRQFALSTYKMRGWKTDDLAEFYHEDFESFTAIDFDRIPRQLRRDLREHLRDNGVYAPKGHGVNIAKALHLALLYPPWPKSERPNQPRDISVTQTTQAAVHPRGPPSEVHATTQAPRTTRAPVFSSSHHPQPQSADHRNQSYYPSSEAGKKGNSWLQKCYFKESQKISGEFDEDLDPKLDFFNLQCDMAEIPQRDRGGLISIMLTGVALADYMADIMPRNLPTPEVIKMLRRRFVTRERTLATREWDQISLSSYIAKHPGKKLQDVAVLMIARIRRMQRLLPASYNNDDMLCTKLLNAVSGVEACRFAVQKPSSSPEGIKDAGLPTTLLENVLTLCETTKGSVLC